MALYTPGSLWWVVNIILTLPMSKHGPVISFQPLKTLLRLKHLHSYRLRTTRTSNLTYSLTLPCYAVLVNYKLIY